MLDVSYLETKTGNVEIAEVCASCNLLLMFSLAVFTVVIEKLGRKAKVVLRRVREVAKFDFSVEIIFRRKSGSRMVVVVYDGLVEVVIAFFFGGKRCLVAR